MHAIRFLMPTGTVMALAEDKKAMDEFAHQLRMAPSAIQELAVKIVTLAGDEETSA